MSTLIDKNESIDNRVDQHQEDSQDDTIEFGKSNGRTVFWQERLLPLMTSLLIGLTIFFFLATFLQISYLHWNIVQQPEIDLNDDASTMLAASSDTFQNHLDARKLEVNSILEAYVVKQRYRQANVLLMSGLWIRYLGFVTGMILALIGASFVLGKLREPTQQLTGKFSVVDVSLRTASPGIILALLGAILMVTTIIDKDFYEVVDKGTYIYADTFATPPSETLSDTSLLEPDLVFGTPTAVNP